MWPEQLGKTAQKLGCLGPSVVDMENEGSSRALIFFSACIVGRF